MYSVRLCVLALLLVCATTAQAEHVEDSKLAYQLLAQKDYDGAIAAFRRVLAAQPQSASIHKDLAYTLLKAGESRQARDEFKAALDLNNHDETSALEYAFLCFETGRPVEARRTFKRLREYGTTAQARETAAQAFQNIDGPLSDGIKRWKSSLAKLANPLEPASFSAHWELAQLAEQRDDLPLAAEQYEICRRLKPHNASLLLPLARVWRQLNQVEQARAALLAVSRGPEPRAAEEALELLGPRYPYVYEFKNALQLDPENIGLRRELAYLYLAMHKTPEAIEEFQVILELAPGDKLSRAQLDALRHSDQPPPPPSVKQPLSRAESPASPKMMGLKSLQAGYLPDAIRYLRVAYEDDPNDSDIALKLGWAYNSAGNDHEALKWFDQARHASNPAIAAEANKAWHNLIGSGAQQTTIWFLPTYSSRWNDAFTYGQFKHNLPFGGAWPVRFYASARFVGDVRGNVAQSELPPQYLSENSVIAAFGAATRPWHRLTGWAEAGLSMSFIPGRRDVGTAVPDYRGGINFAKGWGTLLGAGRSGFFYETTADGIYVSRFNKDWLLYSQHRAGRTFRLPGGDNFQFYLNANVTQDVKREYWANTLEFGPGVKFHLPQMAQAVYLSADWLRGVYLVNDFNPRRPNYNDLRVGFWYAASR